MLDYALAWACVNGRLDVAGYLVERGADVNAPWSTHEPASVLHHCAWRDLQDAARFLLRHGADLSRRDHRYDSTPEGWARFRGNETMANLLAEAADRS